MDHRTLNMGHQHQQPPSAPPPMCARASYIECSCGVKTDYHWCGARGVGCFCKVRYVDQCDTCRANKLRLDAERAALARIKRQVLNGSRV